jgi:hypothetical protein
VPTFSARAGCVMWLDSAKYYAAVPLVGAHWRTF